MAFSQLNGISLCSLVTINGMSRNATSEFMGQTQGISCGKDPILSDGPVVSREEICLGVLDRTPTVGVKFVGGGVPGFVGARSVITSTDGACSGASKLPPGWYVFFGPNGPGYDGYQIVQMDGNSSCYPATVTGC